MHSILPAVDRPDPADRLQPVTITANQRGRLLRGDAGDRWRQHPIIFGLRIHGRVDASLLQTAMTTLTRRHTALRWFFADGHGATSGGERPAGAWRAAPQDVVCPVSILDMRDLDDGASTLTDLLRVPFNHGEPPLIRAVLADSGDHWVLGIAVDHIIFDGGSIAVLLEDLATVCQELASGRSPGELETTVSRFEDFVTAEQNWLESPKGSAALDYWLSRWRSVGGPPGLPLPSAARRVPRQAAAGGWTEYLLPIHDSVRRNSARLGGRLTPFVVVAAALLTAVQEVDCTAGCGLVFPVSRRHRRQFARTVGYLNNQLLLSPDLDADRGASSFPQVCARVQGAAVGALRHAMMPFTTLTQHAAAEGLQPQRRQPYLYLNLVPHQRTPRLLGHRTELTWFDQDDVYLAFPRLNVMCHGREDDSMLLRSGHDGSLFDWSDAMKVMDRAVELLSR
jgi:hypothetical protein